MSGEQQLWLIQQEHRHQAIEAARERLVRCADEMRGTAVGRLVGWVRDRLRVRRDPLLTGPRAAAR